MTFGNPSRVVALVGNPRPASRIRSAAEAAAVRVGDRLRQPDQHLTIDLADLADQVFATERPHVETALRITSRARLLVVATPVYKASYTGLHKGFLDLHGPRGWDGVPVVPLVVSVGPAHAIVGDAHLLPLLAELGADAPSRSLATLENEFADVPAAADDWFDAVRPWSVPHAEEEAS